GNTLRVPVLHAGVIRPTFRPVRAHGDEGMCRDSPMPCLPRPDVVQRQNVVRVLGYLLVYIDYDQGHQHVLPDDLIHRLQAIVEMRGRIDMGAPLTYVTELRDMKSVLLDRVQRPHFHLAEAFPVRCVDAERMCQVNETLACESRVDAGQVRLRIRVRYR